MKSLLFSKFEACGNDFLVVQDIESKLQISSLDIRMLCERKQGVGADGLLLVSRSDRADVKMRIFNSDGYEAKMCGNGLRCVALYAKHYFFPDKTDIVIESLNGIHLCKMSGHDVETSLGEPHIGSLDEVFSTRYGDYLVHLLDTGVPHGVVFTDDIETKTFKEEASALRHHEKVMPEGMNVNFVLIKKTENLVLSVRTFERGVEDETLSCGTGIAASAAIASMLYLGQHEIDIEVRSKDRVKCRIEYSGKKIKNIFLKGSCRHIFDGILKLPFSIDTELKMTKACKI